MQPWGGCRRYLSTLRVRQLFTQVSHPLAISFPPRPIMKGNHMTSQTGPTAAGIRLFSLEDLLQSSTCLQAPMGHRVVSAAIAGAPAMLAALSIQFPCLVQVALQPPTWAVRTTALACWGNRRMGNCRHITDLQQEIHTHRSWHRHHQTSDPPKSEKEDTHTHTKICTVYIRKSPTHQPKNIAKQKKKLNHPQDPKKNTSQAKKQQRQQQQQQQQQQIVGDTKNRPSCRDSTDAGDVGLTSDTSTSGSNLTRGKSWSASTWTTENEVGWSLSPACLKHSSEFEWFKYTCIIYSVYIYNMMLV